MNIFKLPDLGEGLPDAEIVRWLVKEGDTVTLDQPMVEMETAKAVVEVPSPYSGTITKLCGNSGDVIDVGAILVEFDGDGSSAAAPAIDTSAPAVVNTKVLEAVEPAQVSASDVFHLPDLGEGLPDAEIVRWLVAEGDVLALDQPMVEMETAKAVVEVPSPFAARVAKLHGQAGDVIEVGAVLVSFGESGGATTVETSVDEQPSTEKKPADAATVVGAVQVGNAIVVETASAVIKALAKKLKVDLSKVTGTGANGDIMQADVKQAKKDGKLIGAKGSTPIAPAVSRQSNSNENPLDFKASPAVRAHALRLNVALSSCNATGKKGTITKADVEAAVNSASSAPVAATRPSI